MAALDRTVSLESQAYNNMYGLSQLAMPVGLPKGMPFVFNLKDKRHVEILTDIAHILVFEAGEKVAASVLSRDGVREIVWAKNTAVSLEDIRYLDEVLGCGTPRASVQYMDVLAPIVSKCKTRILHYARELVETFQPLEGKKNLFGWSEVSSEQRALRDAIIKCGHRMGDPVDFLDGFIKAAATLDQSEKHLYGVLEIARIFLSQPAIHVFVKKPKQAELLRRLGRYAAAACSIFSRQQHYRSRGFKFRARYLETPPASSICVHSSTSNALSIRSDSSMIKEDSATFEQVYAANPGSSRGIVPDREISIQCTQHPTVTVSLSLIEQRMAEAYIGTSDHECCQWCYDWCEAAFRWNYQYESRGEHPGDWMIPRNIPEKILGKFVTNIENKLNDVRDDAIGFENEKRTLGDEAKPRRRYAKWLDPRTSRYVRYGFSSEGFEDVFYSRLDEIDKKENLKTLKIWARIHWEEIGPR